MLTLLTGSLIGQLAPVSVFAISPFHAKNNLCRQNVSHFRVQHRLCGPNGLHVCANNNLCGWHGSRFVQQIIYVAKMSFILVREIICVAKIVVSLNIAELVDAVCALSRIHSAASRNI